MLASVTVCGLKKLQVGKAAPLMTSRDRGVQLVSRSILDKEVRFKVAKCKPVTFVQQVFAVDPGASPKSLSPRSKKCVQSDEVAERLAHAATLKVQGQIFELVEQNCTSHLVKKQFNPYHQAS